MKNYINYVDHCDNPAVSHGLLYYMMYTAVLRKVVLQSVKGLRDNVEFKVIVGNGGFDGWLSEPRGNLRSYTPSLYLDSEKEGMIHLLVICSKTRFWLFL